MPINADGKGPEMDEALVIQTICWSCIPYEDWPCKGSQWNQPICEACWFAEQPERRPTQIMGPEVEQCCMCGWPTVAGIFIRRHPAECRYPQA